MNGFINLIKPVGMSSNQAVSYVKRILGIKKAGHAGSLDPLASGVLPIMLGRATKLFDYTLSMGKKYICELEFGKLTDTLDTDGEIIEKSDIVPSKDSIISVLPNFMGNIMQIPPKYSALKLNGKRMYQLARDGVEFDVEQRHTHIYELKLLSINANRARFYIRCKSGFYVRSFCRDIAEQLGTVATMTALVRTSAANMNIDDSITIEELSQYIENNDYSFVLDTDYILKDFESVSVDDRECFCLNNGMCVKRALSNNNSYKIYYNNSFLGIAKYSNGLLKMNVLIDR